MNRSVNVDFEARRVVVLETESGGRIPPTGLVANEIGWIGHSNVATFVSYYRTLSTRDLLPAQTQGGITIAVWGDPGHGSYTNAWNSLDDQEPVGGYRAFWVMLGFLSAHTNEATNQGWADHVADRLTTDWPDLEYIWWSPMNTYFATNPGDGDAADLVALDPWGTNPQSLTTWKADDVESEMSWNNVQYAQAQGYFDGYGPWINLTADITDPDERHPSEAPADPVPNGESHGGEILEAFFD